VVNPDQLRQAAAELDAARGQARKELLMAAAPFGMALIGYLGIRKARKQIGEALAQLEADIDDALSIEPEDVDE
jgi:hypothetical protein